MGFNSGFKGLIQQQLTNERENRRLTYTACPRHRRKCLWFPWIRCPMLMSIRVKKIANYDHQLLEYQHTLCQFKFK